MQQSIKENKWWIPGSLQELENNEYVDDNERIRDVLQKSCNGTDYIVYGIENQSTIDSFMPLRVLNYDCMHYIKEAEQTKEKKVHAVITSVFYTGETPWTKSLNVRDYIQCPKELESYLPEFTMNLINITDEYKFKSKSLKDLFGMVRCVYRKEPIDQRFRRISAKIVRLAGILTNTKELEEYKGEEEINMCKAWDERIQETTDQITKQVTEKITKQVTEKITKQAIEQGIEKDRLEVIKKLSKIMSIKEIADALDFDITYVQSIVNNE